MIKDDKRRGYWYGRSRECEIGMGGEKDNLNQDVRRALMQLK